MNKNNVWLFPVINWHLNELPKSSQPGSFGFKRSKDIHTGVDLYTLGMNNIKAVEDGLIVNIENFTGPKVGSPWWQDTQSILICGQSGVCCYGEVLPIHGLKIGAKVQQGQILGNVIPVLKENKWRPNILNHSRYMLHFELYKHGTIESVWWNLHDNKPDNLLDPTDKLQEALDNINNV